MKYLSNDLWTIIGGFGYLICVNTAIKLWASGNDYGVGVRSLASDLFHWNRHEASAIVVDDVNAGLVQEISGLIGDMNKELKRTVADVQQLANTTVHPPRYHRHDLEQLFNVRYLPDNENNEYVAQMQAYYGADDAWLSQPWLENGARVMPNGSLDAMDALLEFNSDSSLLERRFHVEWSGPEMGFGIFASVHIEANEVLDIYSGMINHDNPNSDYEWVHPQLKPTDGRCGIDARISGNLMRFVNDHPDSRNVVPVQTRHRDMHYVIYQTGDDRAIEKGEQMFVSYGDEYWTTRPSADAEDAVDGDGAYIPVAE